jgi:DNA-binding beta-propeller fold protein YncE
VQWLTTSADIGFVPKLHPSSDPEQESIDLFRPKKFRQPEDVALDRANNLFVIDAGSDSLFRFNNAGIEDPAVSFGGAGSGEKQFRHPMGVAWADKTVYVADTGNNRLVRFRLSTELP